MEKVLEVKDLEVSYHTYAGEVKAVRGVSFHVNKGETLAIVGESGCGKTVTAKSILRLIQAPFGEIKKSSEIIFEGKNIVNMTEKELKEIRGAEISMIFQDAMTSLNPTTTVGKQISESLILHRGMNKREALNHAVNLLKLINIPNAEKRIYQYPHEFSGGMRQRVMIAIALACNPKILIADEPTTALDVTIQAQIMELIRDIQKKMGTAVILITHDLGVVAEVADRVQVMYAGKIIEKGTVNEIFYQPQHPYTWALLQSVPRLSTRHQEELYTLKGTPPDLISNIQGCPFASRCEYELNICREQYPNISTFSYSQQVSCWLKHPSAPNVEIPEAIVSELHERKWSNG